MSDPVSIIRAARPGAAPRLAIVLGSGLSGFADSLEGATAIPYQELPGFPLPGVSSHRRELVIGHLAGVEIAVLAGRAHVYEHGKADVMRAPIETMKALGAEALVLTNAAGSLRADMPPGALMAISDHINFSGRNPLIGIADDSRFTDMTNAYDAGLRGRLKAAAARLGIPLNEGVYMWFLGPNFETPAEIRMARTLGADAVGMSTVPETILARHAGLAVAGISTITNLAAGMTGEALSHDETKAVGARAVGDLSRLLTAFVSEFAQ